MARKQNWIVAIIIIASVLFFIFAVSLFISTISSGGSFESSSGGSKVALVEVKGVIVNAENTVRQLEKFADNKSVKAIVLRIDSPGGGVAASQEIYEKVRQIRDSSKVVVASMGSVAASGGYYIACAADTIMALPGTTTGSIGVITEIPDFNELLAKIGVRFEIIKSGKYKDTGTPYRRMTRDERAYMQTLIDDVYEQFVDVVAQERDMDVRAVKKYADGRVFTGQQAFKYGLIDTLGTYDDAIDLAARMGGITGEPKTIKERKRKITFFDVMFQDFEEIFNMIQQYPRVQYLLHM